MSGSTYFLSDVDPYEWFVKDDLHSRDSNPQPLGRESSASWQRVSSTAPSQLNTFSAILYLWLNLYNDRGNLNVALTRLNTFLATVYLRLHLSYYLKTAQKPVNAMIGRKVNVAHINLILLYLWLDLRNINLNTFFAAIYHINWNAKRAQNQFSS